MAGLAEFEGSLIGQRVRAGMERARAEGKPISRPALDADVVKKIRKLRKQGKSVSYIQKTCNVSRGTVVNYSSSKQ